VTAQDPAHRSRRDAELRAEPVLAPTLLDPSGYDELFDLTRRPIRYPMRPRRPVPQPGLSLGIEASDPAMHALARHAHRSSHMRDRHPLIANTSNQQATTMERQLGTTVRHEDLRAVETAIPTASEVFSSHQRTVTNVPAEYT
jgi:hypothetical protein